MTLAQLPVLVNLPPEAEDMIVRLLVVIAAVILVVLIRRIVVMAIVRPVRRLIAPNESRENVIDMLVAPVRLILIALALFISAQLIAPDDQTLHDIVGAIVRVLLLVAALMMANRFVDLLLPTGAQLASMTGIVIKDRLIPFLRVGIKLFISVMGILIVVQELGYNVSGLIAGIGVGGLAISLAAQDTIANMFGFASIVGDSPFSVGEYVRMTDGEGIVEHVGLRSTRIRQLDQTLITLPNNKVANSAIGNMSRMPKRRVDYTIRLTYDTNSVQMRQLLVSLREMLEQWESVERESIQVFFSKFNEFSLDVLVRCYIRRLTWNEMMTEQEAMQLRTMELVEAAGLKFALPGLQPAALQ